VLGIGVLGSYITLNNGVLLISQGFVSSVLIGIAEIFRWSFGFLAAILLMRARESAQWVLLFAFLCGLVASWVSFIPFAGYLMRYADQTSVVQNFIALQVPNIILVLLVFYLFKRLKKSNNTLQPITASGD
jgi:hypothetical protein